jgi:hypothetical protein
MFNYCSWKRVDAMFYDIVARGLQQRGPGTICRLGNAMSIEDGRLL